MGQSRVCSLFHAQCKHSSPTPITFLDLPQNIRDKIYQDAGIIHDAVLVIGTDEELELPVAYECNGRHVFATEEMLAPMWEEKLYNFFDLRAVSREFDADLTRYLIAKNYIFLVYYDLSGPALDTFLQYSDGEICSMERLSILLHRDYRVDRHERSVPQPDTPEFDGLSRWYASSDLQVRSSDGDKDQLTVSKYQQDDRRFVDYWKRFVDRLRRCKDLSGLHLRIAFDAFDFVLIERLLTIMEGLKFGQITIRLEQEFDSSFASRLKQAISSITVAGVPTSQPFRFMDLPSEIRSRILELAGLEVPRRKARWQPCSIIEGRRVPTGWMFQNKSTEDQWCQRREFCCRTAQIIPHCGCWSEPSQLFLICRQLWREATHVFFSTNRLILCCEFDHKDCSHQQVPWFEAADSLGRSLSTEALSAIRELDLILAHPSDSKSKTLSTPENEWKGSLLRLDSNAKNLSVRIYLEVRVDEGKGGWSISSEILRTHQTLVRLLSKCRNLHSMSVFLFYYQMPMLPGWLEHLRLWSIPEKHMRGHLQKINQAIGSTDTHFSPGDIEYNKDSLSLFQIGRHVFLEGQNHMQQYDKGM